MRYALSFALLLSLSTAASASWVDKFGRVTTFSFSEANPVTISAGSHSLADGVTAFDQLCLKTRFDRGAVEKAVAASNWGFGYKAEMAPFEVQVDLGGWNAPDATLRMANAIFFNKKSQCNLTFAVKDAASGDSLSNSAAVDAVSKALGIEPSNAAKRFDKKGNPVRFFQPQWTVTGSDRRTATVFLHNVQAMPDLVHLAVVEN